MINRIDCAIWAAYTCGLIIANISDMRTMLIVAGISGLAFTSISNSLVRHYEAKS